MKFVEALEVIGGLSNPSKMPWYSWSISAFNCKVGSKLRQIEGSICSKCYALKGNYRFKNVKVAHERRLKALDHPQFVEAFVIVLNELRRRSKTGENRFRWHDSGDLQDVEHLEKIVAIARQTPDVIHWLPTREFNIVIQYFRKHGKESVPDNLTIRMSGVMVGETPKVSMGLVASSVGVDDPSVHQCPAYTQGGKCLSCNNCWDKEKAVVNYPLH